MTTVGVGEATTHPSRVLREVEQGGEVVIERDVLPVAKLVAVPRCTRTGSASTVPDDVNDPMPDEFYDLSE